MTSVTAMAMAPNFEKDVADLMRSLPGGRGSLVPSILNTQAQPERDSPESEHEALPAPRTGSLAQPECSHGRVS
jgi:hypothetical protein